MPVALERESGSLCGSDALPGGNTLEGAYVDDHLVIQICSVQQLLNNTPFAAMQSSMIRCKSIHVPVLSVRYRSEFASNIILLFGEVRPVGVEASSKLRCVRDWTWLS